MSPRQREAVCFLTAYEDSGGGVTRYERDEDEIDSKSLTAALNELSRKRR
jgi:hypothetical protein